MSEIKLPELEMLEIKRERMKKFFSNSLYIIAILYLDELESNEATFVDIRSHVCQSLKRHKSKFSERMINDLEKDRWIKKNKGVVQLKISSSDIRIAGEPETRFRLTEDGKKMANFLKQAGTFVSIYEGA